MYQQQGVIVPIATVRPRTVGDVIPVVMPILLATFQLILFLGIIGLEAGSIYYDAGRGTVYAGLWCGLVFFVTWIAMFSYGCCQRSVGCGVYLFVQNIFSAIFAIILIAFTARFINDPCLCYKPLCNAPNWEDLDPYNYNYDNFPSFRGRCTARTLRKLPVLKGLLSCAVLMLVSNLIFIVAYIIISFRLRGNSASKFQSQPTAISVYQPTAVMNPYNQQQYPPSASRVSEAYYYAPSAETASPMGVSNTPAEMRSMKF